MRRFFKFTLIFVLLNSTFVFSADIAPNLAKPQKKVSNPKKSVKKIEKTESDLENNKSDLNLTNYKIPLPVNPNLTPNLQNLDKNETNESKIIEFTPPNLEIFKSLTFSMPSDAAILNEIVVRYTDGAGGIQEKILEINKTINWQNDFSVVSREKPILSKALDVSVTSKDPNLNENSQTDEAVSLITPQFELPIETLKFDDELRFIVHQGSLKLVTADQIKSQNTSKNLLKAEFFRAEIPLSLVSFRVNKGGFSDINITKNDGFYTLEIGAKDGNLSIEKVENGYDVVIR